jgi:hypothetical protein
MAVLEKRKNTRITKSDSLYVQQQFYNFVQPHAVRSRRPTENTESRPFHIHVSFFPTVSKYNLLLGDEQLANARNEKNA